MSASENASSVLGRPRVLTWVMVAVTALLLLLPILVVVPLSFTGHKSFAFLPTEWSLDPYRNFFESRRWWTSLVNSLNIAFVTMIVATVLGVLAALGLRSLPARWRGPIQSLLMAPLIVPAIVTGVAVYGFYLKIGISGSVLGYVVAHSVLAIPFVLVVVSSQLAGVDPTYERAARSLGAGPFTTFRTVLLPLIAPSVVTGGLFAFVTSLDESVVSLFLQSPEISTLPASMYGAVAQELDVTVAAAATLVITASTLVVLVLLVALTRNTAKKGKN